MSFLITLVPFDTLTISSTIELMSFIPFPKTLTRYFVTEWIRCKPFFKMKFCWFCKFIICRQETSTMTYHELIKYVYLHKLAVTDRIQNKVKLKRRTVS